MNAVATFYLLAFVGVAFEFVPGTMSECQVSLVSGAQGDWSDLTGLDHLWADAPSAFFGSDITNYTYYGPGWVCTVLTYTIIMIGSVSVFKICYNACVGVK